MAVASKIEATGVDSCAVDDDLRTFFELRDALEQERAVDRGSLASIVDDVLGERLDGMTTGLEWT